MGEYRRPHYNLMLSRLSERRKCIFVLAGPRQVGKSTVMAQIAETIDKVVFQFNADSVNEEDSDWIRRSWESVRSRMDIQHLQEAVLVIDEIQKIRRWSEYVKRVGCRYPKSCKPESRIAGFVSLAFAQRANRVFSW